MTLTVGPIFNRSHRPTVFCMVADEPLMFAPRKDLTAEQVRHLDWYRQEVQYLAFSMLPMSKPEDRVVLDERFLDAQPLMDWHVDIMHRSGLQPTRNIHFVPETQIYPYALGLCTDHEVLACQCFSYELNEHWPHPELLAVSKLANSKTVFARNAAIAGYRTPISTVVSSGDLSEELLRRNFRFPDRQIVVKTDGMGGAMNLCMPDDWQEVQDFVRSYPDGQEFVVQDFISDADVEPYAADFINTRSGCELYDVRLMLVHDNQWFGNVYSKRLTLSDAQISNLVAVANSVRRLGYESEEGYVCGIDFLQGRSGQYALEVNARWTGGFPIAVLLNLLGLGETETAVCHTDQLDIDRDDAYRTFVERNIWRSQDFSDTGFSIYPVAFSPLVDGGARTVWYFVTGDYGAFVDAKNAAIGADTLPRSADVLQSLLESNAYGLLRSPSARTSAID